MITLEHITLGFGSRNLIEDQNCDIRSGRLTALLGRNGSGKSTLLRAIAGLNDRYSGHILVNARETRAMKPAEKARNLAFVNTERTRIANMRCEDVVATGRAPYTNWIGNLQDSDRETVTKALKAVGMEDYASRTMNTMSDGECQRIMIARALAQTTPVILLDEPTSFLDLPNRYAICSLLAQLAHNENKCILFSTHELDIATKICDDIALINDKKITVLPAKDEHTQQMIYQVFELGSRV